MNIRRYFGKTAREALQQVKAQLGGDAIVLSNRSVEGGVEITAVLASELPAEPAAAFTPEPFRAASRIEQDEDFTVSLSARPHAPENGQKAVVREWQPGKAAAAAARAKTEVQAPTRKSQRPQDGAPIQDSLPGAAESGGELLRELAGIKGLIEQQLAGFAWRGLAQEAPAKTLLLTELLEAGFSAQLSRRLVDSLPATATREEGQAWLKSVLNRNLRTIDSDEEIIDAGGTYALVGPTGVGKTTSTAKLAARCVVRHGAGSVALITTDGYRIGAHEQLRIYGRILGVPVQVVRDGADLRRTLGELTGKHMILIDTIGMSQRDRMVAEQASMLDGAGGVRRLLLVNATSRGDTLDDVVRAYGRESGAGELAGALLTKVDEAASLAPALDALIRHRLELFYVANGQRVPEDLHLPNRPYLLHRALRGLPEHSAHHLIGDEAGLLLAAQAARPGYAAGALHG